MRKNLFFILSIMITMSLPAMQSQQDVKNLQEAAEFGDSRAHDKLGEIHRGRQDGARIKFTVLHNNSPSNGQQYDYFCREWAGWTAEQDYYEGLRQYKAEFYKKINQMLDDI